MISPPATVVAWLLTGMGLGLFSTIYGAFRSQWNIWVPIGHLLDWLWFVIAAVVILAVYFWTDWGTFHAWSLLVIALGYELWIWLAASTVFAFLSRLLFAEARLVFYVTYPCRWVMELAGKSLGILIWVWIGKMARRKKRHPPPPPHSADR